MKTRTPTRKFLAAVAPAVLAAFLPTPARADQAEGPPVQPSAPYRFYITPANKFSGDLLPFITGSSIIGFDGVDSQTGMLLNPSTLTATIDNLPDPGPTDQPSVEFGNVLFVYNGSTLNLNAGYVREAIAKDTSVINTNRGLFIKDNGDRIAVSAHAFALRAEDHATLNIFDGTIADQFDPTLHNVVGTGNATVHILGGTVNQAHVADSATLTVAGANAHVSNVTAHDAAVATISQGTVGSVNATGAGFVHVTGGTISGAFTSLAATITFDAAVCNGGIHNAGGTVAIGSGTVTGDISSTYVDNNTIIDPHTTISGGIITGNILTTSPGGSDHVTTTITGNPQILGSLRSDGFGATVNVAGGMITGQIAAAGASSLVVSGSPVVMGTVVTRGDSTGNISGGFFSGSVASDSNSTLTVTGGSFNGALLASGNSTLLATGGTIRQVFQADGTSKSEVHTATIDAVNCFGSSFAVFVDDTVLGSVTTEASSIVLLGGTAMTFQGLTVRGTSVVEFAAGQCTAPIDTFNSSTLFLEGGFVKGSVHAHDNSSIIYSNGVIQQANPQPSLTLAGAPLTLADIAAPEIFLTEDATLEIDGFGFNQTLVTADDNGASDYLVSGFFANGSPLPAGLLIHIQMPTAAHPTVPTLIFFFAQDAVPEPASLAAAPLTLTALLTHRRRRARV